MDGTYDHNMQIPLTFIYGEVPEIKCNHHVYIGCGPKIRDNALNRFEDPLEASAVAGSLNCELISNLTVHSNEFMCLKSDNNQKFAG